MSVLQSHCVAYSHSFISEFHSQSGSELQLDSSVNVKQSTMLSMQVFVEMSHSQSGSELQLDSSVNVKQPIPPPQSSGQLNSSSPYSGSQTPL